MEIPNSCKGCGKCCFYHVFKDMPTKNFCSTCEASAIRLIYGKCMNLDDNNECIIYDDLPPRCKQIVRGNDECIQFLNDEI